MELNCVDTCKNTCKLPPRYFRESNFGFAIPITENGDAGSGTTDGGSLFSSTNLKEWGQEVSSEFEKKLIGITNS